MLGSTFYHSAIRKYVIAFGNLFNDINIVRVDKDKKRIQQIPVPIRYARRHRSYDLLKQSSETAKYSFHLPAIAFELTGLSYDSQRQINPLNKIRGISDDPNRLLTSFSEIPYKLNFEMTLIAKNTDDICQILEQIIPYFLPDHINAVELVPEISLKRDIKFTLTSISTEDTYEGQFNSDFRYIKNILSFEVDAYFVGPVSKTGIIKRVQVDFSSRKNPFDREERVVITPGLTIDGKPTSIKELSIPYQEIDKEDDYGFCTEEFTLLDGKTYDPISGTDK